jgi:hypothetical protein
MFGCIRRIEQHISNCAVEQVSLRKTRDEKIYRQLSGRVVRWTPKESLQLLAVSSRSLGGI